MADCRECVYLRDYAKPFPKCTAVFYCRENKRGTKFGHRLDLVNDYKCRYYKSHNLFQILVLAHIEEER